MCAQSFSRLKSKYPSYFPARWVFRHARGDITFSPLRAYAIDSAPKVSPKELRLRSDESPLHIDFACKHCGFRTAIGELLARHLSKSHGVKRKSSTWPRDHGVEGLTLQSWDRNGADGHWIVGLDHSAAATSSLDNSLPQDSVSRFRLERSHRDGLERMADPIENSWWSSCKCHTLEGSASSLEASIT